MNIAAFAICTLTTLATPVVAADGPSMERGRELFNGTSLGTNGKSCATCHPNGKGLEEATTTEDEELARVLNSCIAKPLKGKPLDTGSVEMKSLMMYVKSVGSVPSK
jgi:cytochrome c peroxidase